MVELGPLGTEPGIDQQIADLAFRVRRLQHNLDSLESKLQEAIDDIASLRGPGDVRYVRGQLRGRS